MKLLPLMVLALFNPAFAPACEQEKPREIQSPLTPQPSLKQSR